MSGGDNWQKKCRKFVLSCHHLFADVGWDGRKIPLFLLLCGFDTVVERWVLTAPPDSKKLRDHFSCSSPAFFAELAHALKSDEYAADPEGPAAWRDIPTFLHSFHRIGSCLQAPPKMPGFATLLFSAGPTLGDSDVAIAI